MGTCLMAKLKNIYLVILAVIHPLLIRIARWFTRATYRKKFKLIRKITLIIPIEFNHDTQLENFSKGNATSFNYFSNKITDSNFLNVTHRLYPGKRYVVRLFVCMTEISSEDCLAFLRDRDDLLVGAQGLTLFFQLAKDIIPLNTWIISFDRRKGLYLWQQSEKRQGVYLVPAIVRLEDGTFEYTLPHFEGRWNIGDCFVSFHMV